MNKKIDFIDAKDINNLNIMYYGKRSLNIKVIDINLLFIFYKFKTKLINFTKLKIINKYNL